jgi:dTDP-4-dehydrorhamnose 3,5-epimerase
MKSFLTPLLTIQTPGGSVKHAMKQTDPGFFGFGEAYISTVENGAIKGWKRHTRMTCNLVVVSGLVKFVVQESNGNFFEYTIGDSNYARLTIPAGLWFAFCGVAETDSLVLNISNQPHDPEEAKTKPLEKISYEWV